MNVSIVVPLHNEEKNIPPLMDGLLALRNSVKNHSIELVLANDHSRDSTKKLCNEYAAKHPFVKAIHRENGATGMGATLKEGTEKSGGEIVFWVMGDRSDDLKIIPKMVEKIESGFDMVFGSRYIPGGSSGDISFMKALASRGYSQLCILFFGMPVHDITNAYRGFKKEVFNAIPLESNDFAISPEFAIRAKLAGYRLGEVPVTYSDRKAGKTSFAFFTMGMRYIGLFKYLFKRKTT